ncbi:uncharacterized protein [Amphiura filiformis]|uniref:uncharacterized protein n=1 Tax=Amphiura filiformis TaxID=82378 RepID=UPI003B220654
MMIATSSQQTLTVTLPPTTTTTPQVSPRELSDTDHDIVSNGNRHDVDVETKLLFHKVVEPSLGTVNKLSTRRGSSPVNRVPSAKRLYGQLTALKSRPKTQTFSMYSGLTGQHDYVQEDIINVQQRSSSPLSHKSTNVSASVPWTFHSTTKMKQLSLPTPSRSTTPFPRVGSAKGVRSVPICTERYLGTDIKSKLHLR